jgi:hypothetical protein
VFFRLFAVVVVVFEFYASQKGNASYSSTVDDSEELFPNGRLPVCNDREQEGKYWATVD